MSPAAYHPVFTPPPNPNVKIWRYMDFAKYVSLLIQGALWFSRIDRLQLEDRFEGSSSRLNLTILRSELEKFDLPRTEIERLTRPPEVSTRSHENSYVNCWHMNQRESAAMWKLYARSGDAIAVQSTYSRLHASLPDKADIRQVVPANIEYHNPGQTEIGVDEHGNKIVMRIAEVYLGTIHYIDYDVEPMIPGHWPDGSPIPLTQFPDLVPLKYKRKSFEHEKELRAIIWNMPLLESGEDENKYGPRLVPNLAAGQIVRLSLDDLIENVYVAPTAPPYFHKVVASVTSLYGLEREPIRSSLADDPLQ